jgi:hypothetical protein
MATNYAAYGLRLACSFELPGMQAIADPDDGLPTLALGLREPAELEREWDATTASLEWRGRLGDGLDLTIERGQNGEVLFAYGDRARFRLSSDMRELDCAPEHDGLDWQRALISKVLPAISVMRGYEGLHAAALDSPEGVVAIMAPSGSGKSTLALELLGRGWALFADDTLMLKDTGAGVIAHPGSPHMNLAEDRPSAVDSQTLGDTLAILAGERWLAARTTTTDPRPVRMLCLLRRGADLPTEIHSVTPSPLPLAPYILGLSGDEQRERSRFSLYADLMESTLLVTLTADLQQGPARLADMLEGALARERELTGSEVA